MKNFFYSLMTFAAVASALVSCSREEVEVKDNNEFVYRFEIAEGTTKATLDQEGVWWEVEKDKVGVIVDGENIQADVVESDGKKVISFTRETAIDAGTPIYSYYPYSEAVTSAESARVTIPTEQEGASVSAMPMAGIPITLESEAGAPSSGKINFLNLGAIIDFRIYSTNADYANETVESVTFKSDSDAAKASGTATIDLTGVQGGENPSVPTIAFGDLPSYRRATVTQSVSVAASKDAATTPMYLVVAPGTFSGTVTVNTNAASYTFKFTNKTLARNTITKFNMNIGSSKAEREAMKETTYNYVSGNLSEGTYLMVGSETSNNTGLFVCLFPEAPEKTWTDSQNHTFTGQVLNQVKLDGVATDAASFTTTDASIVGSEVELVASGSNWKVLVKKTGEYLAAPTKDYEINYVASESSAAAFTAGTVSSGKRDFTTRVGSSTYYFYHSGSANGFSIRTSSTQNMRFYKRAKKTQTLAFAGTSAEYDLADGGSWITAVPDLDRSGAETDVTYGSSNTAVAEVNPTTGVVTIPSTAKKGDTAVITATAVENEEYEEATANYTITISDSTPGVTVTYYKADALVDGEEYLIVSNDHALKNNSNSIAAVSTPVDANDQIKLEETDGVLWKAKYDGTGFMLMNGDSYINLRNNSLTIRTSTSSSSNYNYWTYNADAEQLTINSRYLYYNNSTFTLSTSAQKAALYTATPQLPAWEISFSRDAAEYDLYGNAWTSPGKPTLTTAATNVTYASSDETVATVSTTGDITALKSGSTTITATAVADATHKKATASYTLTVVNNNPDLPKYVKVTSTSDLSAGAKYLVVFEGLAGDTDGDGDPKVFNPVLESNSSRFAKATSSALPVTIASSTITSDAFGDCEFTLETGYYLKADKAGKYLYPGNSGSTGYIYAESPASNALSITFDNGIAQIKATSGTYYLVWSTSSHYFSSNSSLSGEYSTGICLYKLEGSGGTTPDDPEPPTPSTVSYTKVDAVTSGATYLIVSHTDALAFVGNGDTSNNNTNYISVSPSAGVISGTASDFENCEAVITEESSGSYSIHFTKLNQYFYYVSSTSGLGYESTHNSSHDFTLSTVASGANAGSFLFTKSEKYLYYNDTFFKIGGSGNEKGVHLYKKD